MRGNAMSTHGNDVDDDVIPEFDFSHAIPGSDQFGFDLIIEVRDAGTS